MASMSVTQHTGKSRFHILIPNKQGTMRFTLASSWGTCFTEVGCPCLPRALRACDGLPQTTPPLVRSLASSTGSTSSTAKTFQIPITNEITLGSTTSQPNSTFDLRHPYHVYRNNLGYLSRDDAIVNKLVIAGAVIYNPDPVYT